MKRTRFSIERASVFEMQTMPSFRKMVVKPCVVSASFDHSPELAHILAMSTQTLITIDPKRRSGKPCIRDTRLAVHDVLEYLASGMSAAEIVADFPEITEEDIRACLSFVADRERRLVGAT
jgi:uncharacterized protein (DUF433 family)